MFLKSVIIIIIVIIIIKKVADGSIMNVTDLARSVVLHFAFGAILLLAIKIQFAHILGSVQLVA